ncbi:hypothetical protein COW36_01630 [bacterium (Candidatus Blackallbacteria) CG17_big_fil_post_rev_8_21_14_2_50_48_46]|uniref:Membrane protein 6-pyruvoyl-tetrahydropterin synthase-related domain-containing protein n=1 Tax=bacterium (Candidatus Blackallbacteria) CG17_big_fil_post_rev_8_21_14_2_50_48_46 TaxID=2014261 RepID=A0A2M7GBL4_9BACT|nr:MAG: hypothetical protein COW64_09545 [bacterium (Candidatus Blackallbacteria) CG18_big_fil_WC_8_21_14_2_50_49_26]PIW19566.1 MAG: hypothetical protein COW36_01630 [bacterium (Candidatus Blackallbacteria) CG17_big_fil_post_rev_8_21_14_2_50_48_46]PIW48831.1 MAG: hypothetical protein COW20_06825 [bacterium (Candidatus Blackallbacteria) CG13_big_fil_rev_8_21_14_2_50_49_14]
MNTKLSALKHKFFKLSRQTQWFILLSFVLLLLHSVVLLLGSPDRSYDAWIHLFFGSHWQQSWWNDLELRWFEGFSVFSYPPFAHQLLALTGFLLPWKLAYSLVQTLTLAGLCTGIYRYSRIWFNPEVSALAALLSLASGSVAMTVHLFGQYPNTLSLALLFHLLPWAWAWVQQGRKGALGRAFLLFIPLVCTSLFSNLFGLALFALPVVLKSFQNNDWATHKTHLQRWALIILGLALLGGFFMLPLFWYLQHYPFQQVPIPHGSRNNVLQFTETNYYLFYGLYGPFIILIPILLASIARQKQYFEFLPTFMIFFLLGLGGAFLPNQWLPGRLFYILTFDRFCFWNSLLMTPLAACLLLKLWAWLPHAKRLVSGVLVVTGGIYLLWFSINLTSPFWRRQVPPQEFQQTLAFLAREEVKTTRFASLGLGAHNFARLSTLSKAQTLDGAYYFGRRVTEMNQVAMGMLDEAKYYGPVAMNVLTQILTDPERHHLRYLLVLDRYYDLALETAGWIPKETLDGRIQVWTPAHPISPQPTSELKPAPLTLRLLWGLMPISAFIFLLVLHKPKEMFEG